MHLELSNRVRVSGCAWDDETRVAIGRLRERFTYDNPIYWDARRFRRPCRHIPRKIELFRDDGAGEFSLPRGALRDAGGILGELVSETVDATAFPPCAPRAFNGTLRDYQERAVEAALREHQGVIHAPTGSGKTVVGMALIARLPTPALVVVHTSVLLEQTAARVREFLGIEPGLVGGGRDGFADVTVAMVQTLMRRDLSAMRDRFGLVILDEAHHCPAETFKTVVQEFAARYRIGLTATPARKDRLHPVLFDCIGPIIASVEPRTLVATGSIAAPEVVVVETAFHARCGRGAYARLVNRLAEDTSRNRTVVDAIVRHRGSRNLVLSERVAHCALLAEALRSRGLAAVAVTGEMPREARDAEIARFAAGETEFLVSTTALVGEGFDLPAIDAVFLTVPNANPAKTAQVLGRALRPHEGKTRGRIVDFLDASVPLLKNQFARREKVYRGYLPPRSVL